MDIALLTDPTRCPDCGAALPAAPVACPACALPLQGPLVDRLWRLSHQAAEVLAQRAGVLDALRVTRTVAPVPSPRAVATLERPTTRWSEPGRAEAQPAPHEPVTPRQIQRLLLTLGVLLVAVAAVIFTVVAWGRVGIGGRTAILATLTVASAAGCRAAFRRELPGTAEALATLTLGFSLLDAYGVRRYDLGGAGGIGADAYWAAVLGGLALLSVAAHRTVPLRTLAVAAAIGVQLPLLLVDHRMSGVAAAVAILAQGTAALASLRLVRNEARILLGAGGALAFITAATSIAVMAYGKSPDVVVEAGQGSALLVLVATSAAALAWLFRKFEGASAVGAAVAAAALLGAGHASMYRAWTTDSATAGGAALLLGLTVLLVAVPRPTPAWHVGALLAMGAGGLAVLRAVAEPVGRAVGGELRWADDPWSQHLHATARAVLGTPWPHSATVVLTLALLTAAATLVAARTAIGAEAPAGPIAGPIAEAPAGLIAGPLAGLLAGALATLTAVVLPVATNAPYLLGVLGLIATGAVLGVLAARVRQDASVPMGLGLAGTAISTVGLLWSLAARPATPLALGGVLIGALVVRGFGTRPPYRLAGTVAAALAVIAEAGVLTAIAGQPQERAATAAVLAAGLLAAAAGVLRGAAERLSLEVTGLAGAAVAFPGVTDSAQWTWIALLVAGCCAAVVAMRSDRHLVGWFAGLLLTASTWVRLAMAHAEVPEAYTTGPAVALLVVGWVARRRGRALPSWEAYGAGLTVGLMPSLAATLGDAGLLRPLLLGGAALTVVLLGVRSKLAAPLAIGAAVLAVDAVVQLGPYAAALPRWITIGGAGLLLLVLGVTFERRLRDFRRVAAKLADLA
jgi:hypothetical protein